MFAFAHRYTWLVYVHEKRMPTFIINTFLVHLQNFMFYIDWKRVSFYVFYEIGNPYAHCIL